MRSPGGCLLLLLLAGCTSWRRIETSVVPGLAAPEAVQLWHQGKMRLLHGVYLVGDSITGREGPETCGGPGCRVTLPLAEVDSLRLADAVDSRAGSFGLGFVAGLMLVWVLVSRW